MSGRNRKRPREKLINNERSPPTSRIGRIACLKRMASKDQALDLLYELARIVAPIMSFYEFKVGTFCEMCPRNPSLLGLNVNYGSKICIRLRPASNKNWFYPMNELIGTMLHELTHNKFGPHDSKFYAFLNELKNKYYEIQAEGSYKATGYLAESNRLGRQYLPMHTLTVRQARLRKLNKTRYKSSSKKLGTLRADNSSKPLRNLILEAAERRIHDNKICSTQMSSNEINEITPKEAELSDVIITEVKAFKPPNNFTTKTNKSSKKDNSHQVIVID